MTEPGSTKNLVDSLRGDVRKAEGRAHGCFTNMGIPRKLHGRWLTIGERTQLAIKERQRFRQTIGNLVAECKEYRLKAQQALILAKEKNCPVDVLTAIEAVVNVPWQKPPRKDWEKLWDKPILRCWCGVTVKPDPCTSQEREEFQSRYGFDFCNIEWCCVLELPWKEIPWTMKDAKVE